MRASSPSLADPVGVRYTEMGFANVMLRMALAIVYDSSVSALKEGNP